jgi:HPr kinase/phosphorylase
MAEAAAPPSSSRPGITVRELLWDRSLGLDVRLVAGERGLDRRIAHARIQKSGLVLVGHTHGLVPERVQILGETELSYVNSLPLEAQRMAADFLFSLGPALVLVTRGVVVPTALVEGAERTGTPLAVCREVTSVAITSIHGRLDERLAPRTRIHGVLVDVFEVGVLLLGKSGIGKSECALDLVKLGHRLVADDIVECDYRPPGMIFGEPAELLRHHIEVRGLGILDVRELFGVTAIRERKRIDLVIMLEERSTDGNVDRLGLENRTREILGVPIREMLLIVRPGRNTSSIIEMAARNELLRATGKDSSLELVGRIDSMIIRKPNESGSMAAVVPPPTTPKPKQAGSAPAFESNAPPPVTPRQNGESGPSPGNGKTEGRK